MFEKMYLVLFNRVSDAIEALERGDAEKAKVILIRAQRDTEELYVEGTEE